MGAPLDIATYGESAKVTCAELNDIVVMMPIAKCLTKRATATFDHGIPPPIGKLTASLISGSLTGTYQLAISHYDRNYDSDGISTCLVTASPSNQRVRLNLRSLTGANARIDRYRVWRTLAGGNVLFHDGDTSTAASTYTTNKSDATISANDTLRVGTQAKRALASGTYLFVMKHGARIFGAGNGQYFGKLSVSSVAAVRAFVTTGSYRVPSSTTSASFSREARGNQVGWCDVDNPDSWPSDNEVEVGGPEPIRSMVDAGTGQIAYFKDDDTFLHTYRDDPDHNTGDGSIQQMHTGRGACTFKSAINVDGMVFVMDRRGWYVYGGGNAVLDLTDDIRPLLDRINWERIADISGSYDDEKICWFIPLDGDTECKHCIYLDRQAYQANQGAFWWLANIPQGVRDCSSYINGRDTLSLARGVAGKRFIKIITTQGLEYDLAQGHFSDGLHPALTQSGFTSTGTITFGGLNGVNGQFRFSSVIDARGCFVRFGHSRTPDPLLISSATSTRFTLSASLGFTLPKSTAYTIAAIHNYWRSGVLDYGDNHNKKTALGMDMKFVPRGVNCRMQVKFFMDRMGPHINLQSTTQTGWRATRGRDHVEIDMGGNVTSNGRSGYVEIPVHGPDFGQLQIEAGSSGVNTPWRMTDLQVSQKPGRTNR